MDDVEQSIIVNAPASKAYELWTQVENYPKFMKVLREVRRIDEKTFYWKVERNGKEYEATAEVTLQIPGRRIAWRNTSGAENSGVVCFQPEGENQTRISLKMKYVPDAGWQSPAVLSERLQTHLSNFKSLIETGKC
jgi:uncharacterized membrane protein